MESHLQALSLFFLTVLQGRHCLFDLRKLSLRPLSNWRVESGLDWSLSANSYSVLGWCVSIAALTRGCHCGVWNNKAVPTRHPPDQLLVSFASLLTEQLEVSSGSWTFGAFLFSTSTRKMFHWPLVVLGSWAGHLIVAKGSWWSWEGKWAIKGVEYI